MSDREPPVPYSDEWYGDWARADLVYLRRRRREPTYATMVVALRAFVAFFLPAAVVASGQNMLSHGLAVALLAVTCGPAIVAVAVGWLAGFLVLVEQGRWRRSVGRPPMGGTGRSGATAMLSDLVDLRRWRRFGD